MIPSWVGEYVGIPFVSGGRSRSGCDCYGILYMAFMDRLGYRLPRIDVYDDALDSDEVNPLFEKYKPLLSGELIAWPEPWAVAYFLFGRHPHVGLCVGGDAILHTRQRTGSIVERLQSVDLRNRVEGFYRVSEDYRAGSSILL